MSAEDLIFDELTNKPFLTILGKYDHILGPRAIYYSPELTDLEFIGKVVRDALHTKAKYIILDFDKIYAQGCKIEVEDESARGKKQLYVIILLRDASLPQIPIIHFKRMEMLFFKLGREIILMDDEMIFKEYFQRIYDIYSNKKEVLPMESLNLQVRSGLNTIQGFCELILEEQESGTLTSEGLVEYINLMLDSCQEITKALDNMFT
ncbi:MAG: hypothetical protein ACTSWN_15980 [Promethearchaeota archaeon]